MNELSPCARPELENYLAGTCTLGELEATEKHLEGCLACRDALQRLAADQPFWTAAQQYLRAEAKGPAADPMQPTRVDAVAIWNSSLQSLTAGELAVTSRRYLKGWLAPTDNPQALGTLDEYIVHSIVGRGGMGLVLKAFEPRLGRWVAIKTLPEYLTESLVARERFQREAQVAASLRHPNIVAIYAVSSWRSVPYLVMPYIEPGSLQSVAQSRSQFTIEEILLVALQLADGLAHAQHVVHRDIKPSNILLDAGLERVLIADFGLARALDDEVLTSTGVIAGTPQFMSPEQARGEAVDARSDLFSLGSVLYWLATGRSPFDSSSSWGTLHKLATESYPSVRSLRGDLPLWFDRLVDQLLIKNVAQRSLTAAQLGKVLRDCRQHLQTPTVHPLPVALRRAQTSRPVWWSMFLVAGLVALGAGLCLSPWWRHAEASRRLGQTVPSSAPNGSTSSPATAEIAAVQAEPKPDAFAGPVPKSLESPDATDDQLSRGVASGRMRQGALDALDELVLLTEFPKGIEVAYWLARLETLPAAGIPTAILPDLERIAQAGPTEQRAMALRILAKDPFEPIPVRGHPPLASENSTPFFDQ